MIEQGRGVTGSKWFLLIVMTVFMLLGAAVRSYGIRDPWVQGHIGWSGYRSGNIARNYVRLGYIETRLGPVRDVGPIRPQRFTYDDHPPMVYWLTSISYHLFGVSEWSATLVPILCSSASVGLLFMLVLRLWGLSVASLAAAFMVLVPMDAYYGRMVDHEAPTLLFSLLAFYLYTLWRKSRSAEHLIGIFASLILAMLSDFPGYFVAPWLATYHILTERRRNGRWSLAIPLLVSGPLFFLLWALYLRWLSGSFDILTSRFAIRTVGGWGPWVFTPAEWYRLEFQRIRELYTPTLMLLCVAWVIFAIWDAVYKRDLERHAFVGMLAGFGVTYLVLFPQNAYQHDFVAYYLTPFFCIASAWAVVLLIERFLYGHWHILAALALIVLYAFFEEATTSLRHLYWPRDADYVPVAQYINRRLPEDGQIMDIVEDNYINQWIFYIDRPARHDVTELPLFEWNMRKARYDFFVLDTRLAPKTTLELRGHLFRNYPAEAIGHFLLFDLGRQESSLVVRQLPAETRSVAGEISGDEYLTLLGYSMPTEVTWGQPSAWNRYLYSAEAYWPVRVDIPVQVTLYWRVVKPAPAGYMPAVALRSELDRVYQLDPEATPQLRMYPPENWQADEIVRTDYFFTIPAGYPSTEYTLSLKRPATEGQIEAESEWIPVAELSVQPVSSPKALDKPPKPKYPMVSTPVSNLKFLGYDLERERVRPGETIRLRTYWQPTQPSEHDYALTIRLQNGDFSLTEPFEFVPTRLWEANKTYRADLNLPLPAEILAGQYPMTLKIRGQGGKGSIPLTTLEISADQQIGLIQRWGLADGRGDMGVLSPEKPLRLKFNLREPRALNILAAWTGNAELEQTRVEVYVVNEKWFAPRKYLTTWIVGKGLLHSSWQYIPKSLTQAGTNTIELRVPPPPADFQPLGWRKSLDSLIPGILQDPGAYESGAIEVDFVQVSSDRADYSWEEFYRLALTYAQRNMWNEVKQVYRRAHEKGAFPTDPTDLAVFLEAEARLPDANLRSQLESRLNGLIPNKTSIVFDERVEFIGYSLTRVSPEYVRVEFLFRALQPFSEDYTVWVHATPANPANLFGQAAQAGFFSLDHALGTSGWQPGKIYRDSYQVVLPPDQYNFTLGLWRWQDGSRLWRSDDPRAHSIDLGQIDLR